MVSEVKVQFSSRLNNVGGLEVGELSMSCSQVRDAEMFQSQRYTPVYIHTHGEEFTMTSKMHSVAFDHRALISAACATKKRKMI